MFGPPILDGEEVNNTDSFIVGKYKFALLFIVIFKFTLSILVTVVLSGIPFPVILEPTKIPFVFGTVISSEPSVNVPFNSTGVLFKYRNVIV